MMEMDRGSVPELAVMASSPERLNSQPERVGGDGHGTTERTDEPARWAGPWCRPRSIPA